MEFLNYEGLVHYHDKANQKYANQNDINELTKEIQRLNLDKAAHSDFIANRDLVNANFEVVNNNINTLETNLNDVQATCADTASTVNYMNTARNIYVNAETGDDNNSGIASTKPFATLGKAVELAKKCKKSIIYISAGEYTISGNWMLPNIYCRFQGNTAEDTIIKTSAEIIADNSYLFFSDLSIDSSGTAINTLKAQHGSILYVTRCIITTSYNYCQYGIGGSQLLSLNNTFNGAQKRALYTETKTTLFADSIIDNTGLGIQTNAGCVTYIKCDETNVPKYAITGYGIVYVNGQQVLPKMAVQTKIEEIENSLVGKKDATNSKGEIFGDYEHNTATGDYSATFGDLNTVSGSSSFCTGHENTISGAASFCNGTYSQVTGNRAFSSGSYLIASSPDQAVFGKYNKEDTENKFAYILGGGTNPGEGRRNIFAIDWEGKVYTSLSTTGVDIQELANAVSDSSVARYIYINAETGNDYSNTGLSASSPFKTMEKAVSYTRFYNKVIFILSPGEYIIPTELYQFSNVYRRFQGNAAEDTIIKTSGIVSDSSRLFFENLTLTAEPESNNVLKAQYRGSASFKNCVINTSHYFCAYATSFSDISVVDTTLNGAVKGYALSAIDGSNMRVNNCIDNTGKGIRIGATSVAYIHDTSENPMKYTINDYGMVYLNGQQVAPTPTSETAILSMGGNI